jgi:hypothetical protein
MHLCAPHSIAPTAQFIAGDEPDLRERHAALHCTATRCGAPCQRAGTASEGSGQGVSLGGARCSLLCVLHACMG